MKKLHDSETTDTLSAKDLEISAQEYREAVRESMAIAGEGHIRVNGRRVYAA